MSIFDILGNNPLGTVIDAMKNQGISFGGSDSPFGSSGLGATIGSALESIANQAKNAATNIQENAPGGMGGLLGAGALGAVLGNLLGSNAVKGVALAGASAVAWNFYKKWAAQNQAEGNQNDATAEAPKTAATPKSLPAYVDPTAELIIRSMVYAAKADGNIDAEERGRINAILANMLPGQQVESVVESISQEPIDPKKIAALLKSPQQADDVYRLSCATIDIDHFMERGYLDALAKTLNISENDQKKIEAEAVEAKRQLTQAVQNA